MIIIMWTITRDTSTILSAQGDAVRCRSALTGSHRYILTIYYQNNGTKFMGRGPIFSVYEETGVPGENLPRRVWNQQTKLMYNYWQAALVKGKCLST